jgi:hypothetical protein
MERRSEVNWLFTITYTACVLVAWYLFCRHVDWLVEMLGLAWEAVCNWFSGSKEEE